VTFACCTESAGKPSFKITYSGVAAAEPYLRLLQNVYEELGFEVLPLVTPVKRGIILLNDGSVDADLFRLKSTAENYDNVIVVEPALVKGYLSLLCHKKVQCDLNVLQNTAGAIMSEANLLDLFKPGELKAKMVINEINTKTLDMLEKQRVYYALYTVNEKMLNNMLSKFNHVKIKDVSGYHVINKKHAHLLPKIQQQLQQKLPLFDVNFKVL